MSKHKIKQIEGALHSLDTRVSLISKVTIPVLSKRIAAARASALRDEEALIERSRMLYTDLYAVIHRELLVIHRIAVTALILSLGGVLLCLYLSFYS